MDSFVNNFINTWDEDARNYLLAVEQADGQPLERNIWVAVNAFVVGCKKDDIWDKIHSTCIMCDARTLSGCLVPLKGSTPTNYGFEPADYERKTGLKGNGEDKYLDTGLSNDTFGRNNIHGGVWKDKFNITLGVASWAFGAGSRFISGGGARCNNSTPNLGLTNEYNESNWFSFSRDNPDNYSYLMSAASGVFNIDSLPTQPGNILVFRRNVESVPGYSQERVAFYTFGWAIDLSLLNQRVNQLITGIANAF